LKKVRKETKQDTLATRTESVFDYQQQQPLFPKETLPIHFFQDHQDEHAFTKIKKKKAPRF